MNDFWSPARIKVLRTALGLTQKALAERLDVQEVTVLSWENGHRHPNRFILPRLRELEESLGKRKGA